MKGGDIFGSGWHIDGISRMVLDEVTGERLEIEKRMPSTKPWEVPTPRAWE